MLYGLKYGFFLEIVYSLREQRTLLFQEQFCFERNTKTIKRDKLNLKFLDFIYEIRFFPTYSYAQTDSEKILSKEKIIYCFDISFSKSSM